MKKRLPGSYLMTYSLLALFMILSCTDNNTGHLSYLSFPEEKVLVAEVIPIDTILFRYPFRITIKDSVVIVLDLHNADHYLHAFTYPGWNHICSFGQRGEAPDEMLSGETFHFLSMDSILVLDANKMEITRWQLRISEKNARRVERTPIDKQLIRVLDFCPADSCIWMADYMGEYRFHQVDNSGRYIRSYGDIPTRKTYKNAVRPAMAQAWRGFMDMNPTQGKMAVATQLGEVLEIYDLNTKARKVVCGPQGEPEFRITGGEGIPTGIMGFSDIQATPNYIYTVFHGRSFKDMPAAHSRGERPEDGGRYIHVFDWEGDPVCRYTLDRAVYGIHVDEESGIIHATDVNSDEPIIRYRISEK